MPRYAFLIVTLLLQSACATREGANHFIGDWPPQLTANKPSITINMHGRMYINGKQQDDLKVGPDHMQHFALDTYQSSGLFSEVHEGEADTDLYADINYNQKAELNYVSTTFTFLTLFIIPTRTKDCIDITTRLRNRDGKTLASVNHNGCFVTWSGILQLPFISTSISVPRKLVIDIHRQTLIDVMHSYQVEDSL